MMTFSKIACRKSPESAFCLDIGGMSPDSKVIIGKLKRHLKCQKCNHFGLINFYCKTKKCDGVFCVECGPNEKC